ETPPHGICMFGQCSCILPWEGESCQDIVIAPLFKEINFTYANEGERYEVQMEIIQGTTPVTWQLLNGPQGLSLDPRSGLLIWPRTVAQKYPYVVQLRVENAVGSDENTFTLSVPLSYNATVTSLSVTGVLSHPVEVYIYGHVSLFKGGWEDKRGAVMVHICVKNKDTVRKLTAITNSQDGGRFEAIYYPNPADSGLFEVDARHPSDDYCGSQAQWTVLGMQVRPANGFHRLFLDDSKLPQVAKLINTGSMPLYNISVQLIGFGPPLKRLEVKPSNGTIVNRIFLSSLAPGENIPFDIELDANSSLRGNIGIVFTSDTGTVAVFWLNLRLDVRTPLLRATPNFLSA
ncbi:unnamed protein product, partial [Owenia fusiformis]